MIALDFSMEDDSAWFAWVAKPGVVDGEPKLHLPPATGVPPVRQSALDEVVRASLVELIVET